MIYTRPFITKRFIAYEGDSRISELVLTVQVVDDFSRQLPLVPLNVSLKERPSVRPIRSQQGFYVFEKRRVEVINGQPTTDEIPDDNYTLIVEPDRSYGGWYFLKPKVGDPWVSSFERTVAVTSQFQTPVVLPMNPVVAPLEVVNLTPAPAYPFPANATLVRGTVVKAGVAVPTAVVSTTYEQIDPADATQTKFVFIETITDQAGEYALFFKSLPTKTQLITIHAEKNGDQDDLINRLITESRTLTNQAINFP